MAKSGVFGVSGILSSFCLLGSYVQGQIGEGVSDYHSFIILLFEDATALSLGQLIPQASHFLGASKAF